MLGDSYIFGYLDEKNIIWPSKNNAKNEYSYTYEIHTSISQRQRKITTVIRNSEISLCPKLC